MRKAEKIFRRMKIDSESIASHFMPEIPTVTLLLLVINKQSYHCVVAMALSHTFNCSSHAQTVGKCNKWILLLRLSFWVVWTNVTTQITNGQQISMGTLRYFHNNNNNKRLASNDHSKFTIMNELYLYVYCWRCIKYLCSPVNDLQLNMLNMLNYNISHFFLSAGTERSMDSCCRTHDLCPVKIRAYENKFNITNNSIYTKWVITK